MRYFVVSDIHSFYTPLIKSLDEKGFNKDVDTLIVCGDVFDRGVETVQVYEFLKSLPNKILIRGNHEQLYLDLLKKTYPDDYDYSNGTVRTFCNIANVNEELLNRSYYIIQNSLFGKNYNYSNEIKKTGKKITKKVKESEITKGLESDEGQNYYELNDYVFVHSGVPLNVLDDLPPYYIYYREFEPITNGRDIDDKQMGGDATGGSPVEKYKRGLWKEDKTLVVGHGHCNLFHEAFEKDFSENYDIYYGKNIIAIDTCTARTQRVNVLIIEE